MIGTTLDGKYQIRKLLGEGAMGSVYEAEHTGTGRRCAVKIIISADMTRDPKVVSRFQREARAAGAIDTQHITQVLDAGVDRETNLPFLAMEFLSGEDVQHLLKRIGPVVPELGLRIVAQACLGLQKAHEASVVHRDIKPHNLFLARRDAGEIIVKLLDFGIAKVKMDRANETESAELTRTGNLIGSPLYMSPEQARGQKDIDHRTDIWSLGAVLYQLLTGRTPYHHITALGQLIIAICSEPPPPVQELAPWVQPEVAAIVHRCLQQDPGRRYQTAEEMFHAIRPLLPYGWGIHDSMLVALTDSLRGQSAPRLSMGVPPQPAGQSGAYVALAASAGRSGGYPALGSSPGYSGGYPAPGSGGHYGAISQSGSHEGATTAGALAQSQGTGQRAPARLPLVAGAVVFATVAVAGGVFMLGRSQPAPAASPPVEPPAAPAPTPSSVSPPPAPEVVAGSDAAPRRVKVVILPSDASVEVEGKPTVAAGGILEISGALGTVHKVRVFKGGRETLTEVVVTETGAFPPKVELLLSAAKAPATSPATGGAARPAPVPTTHKGIIHDTGEFGK